MEFESKDVFDSQSSTSAIFNSYYPNGELIVKNTTQSLAGPSLGRTLTTRSLSEAMSGDALFRSPKFSNVFYNKALSSSLTSSLTAGSETAFSAGQNYSIPDPEGTTSKAKLTGGAAFASVLSRSIVSTNAGQDFVSSATNSLGSYVSTDASYPTIGSSRGSTSGSGPSTSGSSAVSTTSNTTTVGGDTGATTASDGEISTESVVTPNVSAGSRKIVFEEELTADEKSWLNERSNLLALTGVVGDHSYLTGGFPFDVPNTLNVVKLSYSDYPGGGRDYLTSEMITSDQRRVRVCPSLIEMLIALNNSVYIHGGVGGGRGMRDGMATEENSTLSDHAIGRAFDVSKIGRKNEEELVLNTSKEIYKQGLEIFLGALNALPIHLVPDVLVISDQISSDFGIVDQADLEGDDTLVKQMFPNLKWTNFGFDSNHRDHIHVSWTTSRSGIYTGPGGEMNGMIYNIINGSTGNSSVSSGSGGRPTAGTYLDYIKNVSINQYIKDIRSVDPFGRNNPAASGGTSGVDLTLVGSVAVPTELSDPKFTKSYLDCPDEALTKEDIFALLRLTVSTDELAAVFGAISERESGYYPNVLYIVKGSDWSIGLFQTSMRPSAQGSKTFYLPVGNITSLGWQLAYRDWEADGITAENFETAAFDKADENAIAMFFSGDEYKDKTIEEKKALVTSGKRAKANKSLVNEACWVPINQAYLTYTTCYSQTYSNGSPKLGDPGAGYALVPWGDYGRDYGWIRNTKWSSAAALYSSVGKDPADLKRYLIDMYDATGATRYNFPSQAYIDQWTDGYFFPGDGSEPYLEA
jgi:hypothetical protein